MKINMQGSCVVDNPIKVIGQKGKTSWEVTVNGERVCLKTAELLNPRGFARCCLEQVGIVTYPFSELVWRELLRKLLEDCRSVRARKTRSLDK